MRAILSVYDKTGIAELAKGLHDLGWELFSTGRTQSVIAEAGVPVESIAEMTGSPEMLEGRVKTLHPKVHGGLLARRDREDDAAELAEHGIEPIDLVAGNLYPFIDTVSGTDVSLAEALEEIDIGGPTMIRAAAKNHPWVVPVVDPSDYAMVLEALRAGGLDAGQRRALAAKAFAHVSHYDAAIAEYLRGEDDLLPEQLTLAMTRVEVMRYGENPHQRGAFYRARLSAPRPSRASAASSSTTGKGLSYVNLLDADAAYNLVCGVECPQPAVAIIKHTNPVLLRLRRRGRRAHAALRARSDAAGDCDLRLRRHRRQSIARSTSPMADRAARRYAEPESPAGECSIEIVIAPELYEPDGLEHLQARSRSDLRILDRAPPGDPRRPRLEFSLACAAGCWCSTSDLSEEAGGSRSSSERERRARPNSSRPAARLACRASTSSPTPITLVRRTACWSAWAPGSRTASSSARLCGAAARVNSPRGAALASTDAFFPFPDTDRSVAGEAGVHGRRRITGGSIRDEDSVADGERASAWLARDDRGAALPPLGHAAGMPRTRSGSLSPRGRGRG